MLNPHNKLPLSFGFIFQETLLRRQIECLSALPGTTVKLLWIWLCCVFFGYLSAVALGSHTGQQPCHFLPPWWKLEGDPGAPCCHPTTGRSFGLLGKNLGGEMESKQGREILDRKAKHHVSLGPGSHQSLLQ